MSEEEVKKIKEKYEEYLRKIGGVVGVGYNHSINIYVERLTPQLAAFLPRKLDGVPVRIVQTGGKIVPLALTLPIPVAAAIYADRTLRFRPSPGGVSCGHPQVTAGTLSCRAIDKTTKETLGLSNNHVIALNWGTDQIGKKGDSTLQPGPYDGGRDPDDKIGELERWVPVELAPTENLVDVAAFKSDLLSKEIYEVGDFESWIPAEPGMKIVKSGRTSGVSYSEVFDVHATVTVSGAGDCVFKDQIIAKPAFLSPGDSGSWVGHADSLRTIGLGFAGATEISVICKAAYIEQLLDIYIVPPSPSTLSPAIVLAVCGVTFGAANFGLGLRRAG